MRDYGCLVVPIFYALYSIALALYIQQSTCAQVYVQTIRPDIVFTCNQARQHAKDGMNGLTAYLEGLLLSEHRAQSHQ